MNDKFESSSLGLLFDMLEVFLKSFESHRKHQDISESDRLLAIQKLKEGSFKLNTLLLNELEKE